MAARDGGRLCSQGKPLPVKFLSRIYSDFACGLFISFKMFIYSIKIFFIWSIMIFNWIISDGSWMVLMSDKSSILKPSWAQRKAGYLPAESPVVLCFVMYCAVFSHLLHTFTAEIEPRAVYICMCVRVGARNSCIARTLCDIPQLNLTYSCSLKSWESQIWM